MTEEESKNVQAVEGELCPICRSKTLTMTEADIEVPYFGKMFIFSMQCSSCKFRKADVEAAEHKEPSRWTLEIDSEEDMKARVVKSSDATVKIPRIGSIEPGSASEGYITNVEGIFERIKQQIEHIRDSTDDETEKKKAKNLLKKIRRISFGEEKAKLIIEDPTGNSAIISDKAERKKL